MRNIGHTGQPALWPVRHTCSGTSLPQRERPTGGTRRREDGGGLPGLASDEASATLVLPLTTG